MSRAAECLLTAGHLPASSALLVASERQERPVNAVTRLVTLWIERSRQRRELRELADAPDDLFKDVGLTRYDVQREARKRFWCE